MKLSVDEARLLRLFRCLTATQRSDALRQAAVNAVGTLLSNSNGRDDVDHTAPSSPIDLEEELQFLRPPIEPAIYLDEYLNLALEYAFPDGVADPVLGISDYDAANAAELLKAVEWQAVEAAFPEAPWFTADDMLEFLQSWRSNVVNAIERAHDARQA